jgi:hypothetical protein
VRRILTAVNCRQIGGLTTANQARNYLAKSVFAHLRSSLRLDRRNLARLS